AGDKWLNDRCDTKCSCSRGQLDCTAHRCNENSVCALGKNGRYKCRPVSFEACLISGDPHYLTFDGLAHHFQGEGTFTLVTTDSDHSDQRLQIDKEQVTPPYDSRDGFRIYQRSRTLHLETDFGLSVNFDGRENADIVVPSLYKKKLRGLCGNYDGKYRNDFTLPDGTRISDVAAFGNSWKVQEGGSGGREKSSQPPDERRYRREIPDVDTEPESGYEMRCTESQLSLMNSTANCGGLLDPLGPFRDCHPFINPHMYHQNCLFDLCQSLEDSELRCTSYEMYVQACQANGTQLPSWRSDTGCAMTCPANSNYTSCMDACPSTCADLAAPSQCDGPCTEGCECSRGFVYSGLACVPYHQCGCTYYSKYYQVGERFLTENCAEDCACITTDTVQCLTTACPENTTCAFVNSTRACVKKGLNCNSNPCQNYGVCEETGDGIKCLCRPLYRGENCEDVTVVIVIGVVAAILFLIIVGAIISCLCYRRRGLKGSGNVSEISSIDIADITQSMQLVRDTRHIGINNPHYQY
ncbi:zonadhesin-like, partial [Leucoraja erinacea]|uniref:zonadhesin-like n=1 Tax=Leucoraja erinaceus TaxID=7782 RepID=UPI002456DEFE